MAAEDPAHSPLPLVGTEAAAPSVLAGIGWAALTVTIFAGWFVVTRFSVTRELRLWDVTALRFGIGAVILAPSVLLRGRRLAAARWREGLLYACLWGVPFVLMVALGLQLTSASQASAIAPCLMPVFSGVLAAVLHREAQGRIRWSGYATIVLGLVVMVTAGAIAHGAPSVRGLAALVAAAAMWAAYTLLFRRSTLTPVQSAALICIWSALLFLPTYVLLGLSRLRFASAGEIALQAIYQGVLMSGVAIVSFNRSVALLGRAAATAIIALIPVVASLAGIPALRETPSVAEWVAIAAVVSGVLLVARPAHHSRAPHSN
jgi:drug/metabolite transporter (DMT)-like permease